MPRRSPLSASDRATLLALPTEQADRIRVHSFSETDLALVRQRRGIDAATKSACSRSWKNALRSGDIWVEGSRQFRNFDDYLISKAAFDGLAATETLPLAIDVDADRYLEARLALLHDELATVNELADDDALPDAAFGDTGLKVTPLGKV